MRKDPVFGLKCCAELGYYDHATSLLKTSAQSLFGDSTEFLQALPKSGWMRSGKIYLLQKSVPDIDESESGLWLTPTVMDHANPRSPEALKHNYDTNREGRSTHSTLREQVFYPPPDVMWPTPKSAISGPDYARANREGSGGDDLVTAVAKTYPLAKMYPTPTVQDGENNGGPSQFHRNTQALNTHVKYSHETPGNLCPDWVEYLMGYDTGWTDIKADTVRPFKGWDIDPADLDPNDPEYIPRLTTVNANRAARLKALGNSIVPQIAEIIFKRIKTIMEAT